MAYIGNQPLILTSYLRDLYDVDDSARQDGYVLVYDGTELKWVAQDSATNFDNNLATKTTDDITEGSSNLFYTDERVDDRIDNLLVDGNGLTKTYDDNGNLLTLAIDFSEFDTDDIVEGSVNTFLASRTTDDISEGSTNLYYTDARVQTKLGSVSGNILPDTTETYDIGSGALRFRDLYLSGTSINLGGATISANVDGEVILPTGSQINGSTLLTSGNSTDDITEGSTNLYYTEARATNNFNTNLASSDTGDLAEGTNLYYTDARARGAISVTGSGSYNSTTGVIDIQGGVTSVNTQTGDVTLSTTNIEEGDNLYYTEARATSNFGTNLAASDTDDLSEGVGNLYFTEERVDDRVAGLLVGGAGISITYGDVANQLEISLDSAPEVGYDLSSNTTDDLSEGVTNLYFTQERVKDTLSGGTGITFNDTTGEFSIGQDVDTTSDVTFNNVTVSGTLNTDDVTATTVTASGNVVVQGDLTVNGTTTTVNSNEVNIGDAIILLNSDEAGTPSQNAGLEIERGTETNVTFIWDEALNRWTVGGETFVAANFIGDLTGNVTGDLTGEVTGDLIGSVYADDSTLLVDGINGVIPTSVLSGDISNDIKGSDIVIETTTSPGSITLTQTGLGNISLSGTAIDFNNSPIENFLLSTLTSGTTAPGSSVVANDTSVDFNFSGLGTKLSIEADAITIGSGVTVTGFVGDITGTVSDISNHDTGDLSEGSNLYYTDARSRAAISVTGSGSYNSTTGVIDIQGGVTSVNTQTGDVVLDTGDISEGSNLYYTDARVRAAVSASGDLSYNDTTGEFSVTTYKTSDFETDLAASDTGDLAEGTNLYYTDARARNAISVTGNLTYNSTTGEIGYTERTDAGVRGLFSAGGDLSYNSVTGEFSVTTYKSADFDSDFSGKSTSDLSEGTNLYYTDTRVGNYLTTNGYALESYVDTAISNLVDTAPTTLDTLNELAAALGDDPNFATTITDSIGTKLATADFDSTFDTRLGTKTTDDLSEGTNLYYTDARVQTVIDNNTAGFITGYTVTESDVTTHQAALSITESQISDLVHYTDGDADARIALQVGANLDLSQKSTTDLAEGTNLYYTTARADSDISAYLTNNSYATETYVDNAVLNISDGNYEVTTTSTGVSIGNLNSQSITITDDFGISIGGTGGVTIVGALGSSVDVGTNGSPVNIGSTSSNINFSGTINGIDTDDVSEGTNLYYTDARVQTVIDTNSAGFITDYTVTEADVTQHQAALTITESQISDLVHYNDTDADARIAAASIGDLSDVDITTAAPTNGQTIVWDSTAGEFVPGDSFSQADFDTAFTAKDTDALSEGTTNLYYTDARVNNYLTTNNWATQTFVNTAISDLVDTAPTTLDTLNELAAALGDDPNFATTVTNSIGTKLATADFDSTFDTRLALKSTDDLAEGTNLYYTNARVQGVVTKSYVEGLNVASDFVTYDNTSSQLASTTVKAAIDELQDLKADVSLLSSNINLFPTDSASDVTGYYKLVTTTGDVDYDTTAVDIPTGAITTADQLIASLAGPVGQIEGSIEGISITTVGNIEKTLGNSNQGGSFHFEVYKRENDGTETLIGTSNETRIVYETDGYEQFFASALIYDSGAVFTATDRFVIKFYGTNHGGGSPEFQFQFGGTAPIKILVPVPVEVIVHENDAIDIQVDTTNFNGLLSGADSDVQTALETLDDLDLTHAEIGTTAPTSPVSGDFWYDTSVAELFVYDGANWLSTADGVGDFFVDKTTTDLTEGDNLYYTDTRARNAISAGGDLSYNPSTGVISFSATAAPVTSVNGETGVVTLGTDDITEGTTNLYYTTARSNADFDTRLATKSTTDLGEGTNLYYTDARVQSVIDTNTAGFITDYTVTEGDVTTHQAALSITESQISDLQPYLTSETTTSLAINANVLTFTDETGTDTDIDLSLYLDDTNLAYIVSGSVDANTGIATFSRDDASSFTVDFSAFLDDTNLTRIDSASFNTTDGVLTLTRGGDSSTVTVDLDGRFALSSDIPVAVSELSNDSGYITDYTVTEADVTAHQAALSITESQVSDLQSYLLNVNNESIGDLLDVDITTTAPEDGQSLIWDSASSKFLPGDTAPVDDESTYVSSTLNQQVVDTFATAEYRGAEYLVTVSAALEFNLTKILIVHDGSNAYLTQYGEIGTDVGGNGTFDVRVAGGNVELLYTPSNQNSTVSFKRTVLGGSGVYSSSTLDEQVMDAFDEAKYRGAEYTITVSADTEFNMFKLLVVHDGIRAYATLYGEIGTDVGGNGTFDARILSGNVEVLYTPNNADSTVQFTRELITNAGVYSEFPADAMSGSGTVDLMDDGNDTDLMQ